MLIYKKHIFSSFLCTLLWLAACNQNQQHQVVENDNRKISKTSFNEASLVEVGSGQSVDGELFARVYANDSLVDTYQHLFIKLENAKGNLIEKAHIQFMPEMKMGMMAHGAPTVQPAEESVDGFFRGGVVFIMPSSSESGHSWVLNVLVDQPGEKQNRVNIPLQVKHLERPRTIAFDGGKEGRFFLSLLDSDSLKVGEQSARFNLYRIRKNEYPAVFEGYEIQLETHMPDMGHGSEGNVAAAAVGDGNYEGKINLPMAGLWEIGVSLLKDGKKVSTEPITFQVTIKE